MPGFVRGLIRRGSPNQVAAPAPLPEWEYLPHGWRDQHPARQGWNVPSVADTQKTKWPEFLESLEGTGPLGISHESPSGSGREGRWAHNLIMSYGYVLALASRDKTRMSLLDWGGGIGHYYPISKTLVPELELDYSCQDVPALSAVGRELQPQIKFFDEAEDCFARTYDLVVAGSSLWYVHDWKTMAQRLARASSGYLYVTRMMFVRQTGSYVAVQRPTSYGYLTEYQFWVLNQGEFVRQVEDSGMTLMREFIFGEGPHLEGAPEQGEFKGFLFKRSGGFA